MTIGWYPEAEANNWFPEEAPDVSEDGKLDPRLEPKPESPEVKLESDPKALPEDEAKLGA